MPLPKRRTTRSRRGNRRSHDSVTVPAIDTCPRCHSAKLAHHVCPTCGTYLGRQAIEIKSKKGT